MFNSRKRKAELTEWQAADGSAAKAVVLLLPGGSVRSHRGPSKIAELALRDLSAELTEAGRADGIAVHLLHYRFCGWNGDAADTAVDARWALDELARRYGDLPVVLVGNSLGGRAAFAAAGHPSVVSVVGLAPWLPEGEPVDHLAGRRVLIIHGDKDRGEASAAKSLAYATRAREVAPDLARYEVPGAGHFLVKRAEDIRAFMVSFILAALDAAPWPTLATDLHTPLPARDTAPSA